MSSEFRTPGAGKKKKKVSSEGFRSPASTGNRMKAPMTPMTKARHSMQLPSSFSPQSNSLLVYEKKKKSSAASSTDNQEETTTITNVPNRKQGVWQDGYSAAVSPTELWIFLKDDPPKALEGSKHIHGVWGLDPDCWEPGTPLESLDVLDSLPPSQVWIFGPQSKTPKYFVPRGMWTFPLVKTDISQLNPEESGFLHVSDSVKANKLDVGGQWKMLYRRDGLPAHNIDEPPLGPGISPRKSAKSKKPTTMELLIHDPQQGRTFTLKEVDPNDTIEKVQQKIHEQENIPVNQQRLSFQGRPLSAQGSKTLKDYGIQHRDTLTLDPMQIQVELLDGTRVPLDVRHQDTLQDVKRKLQDQEGIPISEQRLARADDSGTKNGILDEDNDPNKTTLEDVGIHHGDVLKLQPMELIIRDPTTGQTFTLHDIHPNDTIDDIKDQIENHPKGGGIPKSAQRLHYQTKPLSKDHKTLRDYGIPHRGILDLEPMTVQVKTPDGNLLQVPVKPQDTVAALKDKIKDLDPTIPVDDLQVTFQNKTLPDHSTLKDHGIQHGDTVELGGMYVMVKDWKKKETRLDVTPTTTIGQIKERLEKTKELDVDKQILTYPSIESNESLMLLNENAKTLADYGIPNGAVLNLDKFKIYVQVENQGKFTMEVDATWKVKRIQQSVEARFQMKLQDQEPTYEGTVLETNSTIGSYGIQHKDTVHVAPINVPEYDVKIGAWQDPFAYQPKSPYKKKVGVRKKTIHDTSKDYYAQSEGKTALDVDIWANEQEEEEAGN